MKSESGGHRWGGARAAMAVALVAALVAAGGCAEIEELLGQDESSSVKITTAPYTTTTELDLTSVTGSYINLNVDIPEESLAIGIVVQTSGTSRYGFIEHEGTLLGGNDSIRDPKGKKAPLEFNEINDEPLSSYFNPEAGAVHFPNDGQQKALRAGTWKFPIGAARVSDGALVSDTLEPFVFYKTETSTKPTLKLNVFVLEGVNPTIDGTGTDAAAAADAEIQGAVTVLKNVYGNNASTQLSVDTDIIYLDNATSGVGADGVIDTDAEQYALLSAVSSSGSDCSSPPDSASHDAMNIFVVASLDHLPTNVIGVAAGIPGPFNRHCTAMSGTLAEYQNDGTGTVLGYILAHEFGHFLGLYHTSQTGSTGFEIVGHDPVPDTEKCKTSDLLTGGVGECPDRSNLMFPIVNEDPDPPVSVGQGNVIKFNPGVLVP